MEMSSAIVDGSSSSSTIDVDYLHPSDNPGMNDELRERMELFQELTVRIFNRQRSGVLHKEMEIDPENIEHTWQMLIEDKTKVSYAEVQQGMQYIKVWMAYIQLGKGKWFEEGNQSDKLELLRQGKEYFKQAREYIQQGIECIKKIRSDVHPEVLPGTRFEDRQGKEYIREASGSGSTNPVLQQESGLEDQQRMEYIREADTSGTNHVDWQGREYRSIPVPWQNRISKDQQGTGYIRQEESGGKNPVRRQYHRFENGIENVRQAGRSGTNHVHRLDHGFEDRQGIEYIQQASRSGTNHARRQEHGLEDRQGMEYIRQADRSGTNHARHHHEHGFEDRQEMEYIHEAVTRSSTSHELQQEGEDEDS
ncbi:uncharacterized protein LOC141692644 [Apium graveolens]|uniref:uncharacterized protein LOC141692644 n=1 Tax=Apium graveolens TaxID=4045 RepID=UPI003D7BFC5B